MLEFDTEQMSHAFLLPWERFVFHQAGRWHLETPLTEKAFLLHLSSEGMAFPEAKAYCKAGMYPRAYGTVKAFGEPRAVVRDGLLFLNSVTRPTLVPKPGKHPTIDRILDHHVRGDGRGREWLEQWFAQKVQAPGLLPRVAVVLVAKPGSGKGSLYTAMRMMLGDRNCTHVNGERLEARFNADWAERLFIFADEITTEGGFKKDISQRLKVLIDHDTIEVEQKGQPITHAPNHLAWFFASNDRCPVRVEKNDRRYTVYMNPLPLEPEYAAAVRKCFWQEGPEKGLPTPAFVAEVAAWFHRLRSLPVDHAFVARPYDNASRRELIGESTSVHESFFDELDEMGIDHLIVETAVRDSSPILMREAAWALPEGIAAEALYRTYRHYVRENGGRPMAKNRFGALVSHCRPDWSYVRAGDRRIGVRVGVPRTPKTSL